MESTKFILNLDASGQAEADQFPVLPKYGLYLILSGRTVIRIGECASGNGRLKKGFREPLRKVLRGKERKNYIAYSWRTKYNRQSLSIHYFDLSQAEFVDPRVRRALEAEITFQFRLAKRKWPAEMSEIHFLEEFRRHSVVVRAATDILKVYRIQYDARA